MTPGRIVILTQLELLQYYFCSIICNWTYMD